jgi:hypothetical protein
MTTPGGVALYIDFENVHASLFDRQHGEGAYKTGGRKHKPAAIVDVDAIVHWSAQFGRVRVVRAYGDFRRMTAYSAAFLSCNIELVQLFPTPNSKNGADIRLAVDAVDDCWRLPDLTHCVIAACDADYLPVCARLRAAGRLVAAVVVKERCSEAWREACDEWIDHDDLRVVHGLTAA